jgi:iron complex outermembrane receptor protein
MDAFSPSIGLDLPVTEQVNLFGSMSTVFTTPTTSELSNQESSPGGFNPDLDPMTGRSFEVGVRAQLGATAALEVAAYQTNLENELIPFEVDGSPGINYFRNAGESRHRGIETTLSAGTRSGFFRGDLTYTYTDARFERYVLGANDLSGNRVPGIAPRRIQGILRISPTLPFSDAFIEIVATAMDDVPTNDRNTAAAPAYELVDLRIGLDGFSAGGIFLSPWAAMTNALDEDYIASVAVNAAGSRFFEPGPPRAFQLGVRARWGTGD